MEELVKIVGIGMITIIIALFLNQKAPTFSICLVIVATLIMLSMIINILNELIILLRDFLYSTGLSEDVFMPVIKVCGVSVAVKITSDLCKDAGYSSIGSKIQFAGSIICTGLIMPLFMEIIEILKGII